MVDFAHMAEFVSVQIKIIEDEDGVRQEEIAALKGHDVYRWSHFLALLVHAYNINDIYYRDLDVGKQIEIHQL